MLQCLVNLRFREHFLRLHTILKIAALVHFFFAIQLKLTANHFIECASIQDDSVPVNGPRTIGKARDNAQEMCKTGRPCVPSKHGSQHI